MGGSSGGGSSGKVDYPDYMKNMHETWLTDIDGVMDTAITGDNPYTSAVAYDPDCALEATNFIISKFYDEVIAFDPTTLWSSIYDSVETKFAFSDYFSDTATATAVTAYQTDLESRRDSDFKPAYKVGMLNANAVMSSSFVLGDALITAQVARDVAKFSADLTFQNEERQANYELKQKELIATHDKNILDKIVQEITFYQSVSSLTTDANRIRIVAKSEELDNNYKYDEKDALWDLEVYKYGGDLLAAIGGGTSGRQKVSTGASVLGGALSGAALGAQVSGGNPIGAGIGAVVGGVAGLF